MPLGAIDRSVVGQERQFAVACFLAAREDVARVGRSEAVALAFVRLPIDLDAPVPVPFLERIAGGAAIQGQADGVEQGGFAAAGRSHDAENRAVTQDTVLEVDGFAPRTVQGGEVAYFKFQECHQSSLSCLMDANNSLSICS